MEAPVAPRYIPLMTCVQRLISAACVALALAGPAVAAAEVAAGLSTDSEEIEAQCEQLARTGQWVRETGVADWPDGTLSGRYSFRHALYHEVVYARVAEARLSLLPGSAMKRVERAWSVRGPAVDSSM